MPHWLTEGLAVRNEGFPRPPRLGPTARRAGRRTTTCSTWTRSTSASSGRGRRTSGRWRTARPALRRVPDEDARREGDRRPARRLPRRARHAGGDCRRSAASDVPAFETGYKTYVREVVGEGERQAAGEAADAGPVAGRRREGPRRPRPGGPAGRAVSEAPPGQRRPRAGRAGAGEAAEARPGAVRQGAIAAGGRRRRAGAAAAGGRRGSIRPNRRCCRRSASCTSTPARFEQAEAMYRRGRQGRADRNELARRLGPRLQADRRHDEADRRAPGAGADGRRRLADAARVGRAAGQGQGMDGRRPLGARGAGDRR